jgi:RHS repeat-associated protein
VLTHTDPRNMTYTNTWDNLQRLTSATFPDGTYLSNQYSYSYTDRLRTALNLLQPNASAWAQSYIYDLAGRMTGIISQAGTFAYTYNPGVGGASTASSLVERLTLPNRAWITNTYDANARMLGTWLYNSSGSALDSSVYTNNVGNQRISVTRSAENTASYAYDLIGQVIGDVAAEGTTNRLNEQLHYVFDPAGNLLYRTNNTLIENFQVNNLNELTANTNGGKLTVVGTTTSTATNVTVNATNTAQRYGDATFAATNFPFLSSYTAVAADSLGRRSTNTVNVSINTNNTAYVYDGNGNLLYDGLRTFAYDDENQLIQVLVTNQWLSQFSYDGKMRQRIRQEYTWLSGQWVLTNAVYYVYDANVVIQERNINNLPSTTYTRGLDLSASLQGAGGIGSLLSMTLNTAPGPSSSNSYFYHSDGNGNVAMLVNPSQYIVAKYLYDAFGNVLSAAGSMAQQNLYRFSSKEAHLNSGLVYYLYRFYDPNLQRWPNRDPYSEGGFLTIRTRRRTLIGNVAGGGANLYEFVMNGPTSMIDPHGLLPWAPIAGRAGILGAGITLGFGIDWCACRAWRNLNLFTAEREANDNAPDGSTHRGVGAREGNDADLLTHCIASCRLAQHPGPCLGPDGALASLQAREGNDPGSLIDRLNNQVGNGIGINIGPTGNCLRGCLDALTAGLLYTLSPGPNPMPVPHARGQN